MGYEVKKKYPGEPSAFGYFQNQYPGSRLKVVSFEGKSRGKAGKSRGFLYPWEIYRE